MKCELYNGKYYYSLLLLIGISVFITNMVLSFQIPITQDEATTIFLIKQLNLYELFKYFYLGNDTQVPLYFVIVKIFSALFNNQSIYFIRLFSIIFGIIGIWFNYLLIKKFIKKELFCYYLIIISTTNYFFLYYLSVARPYSLFFCLFSIQFYLIIKFSAKQEIKYLCVILFTSCLLNYTHYFGIIYLILELLVIMLFYKGNKRIWLFLIVLLSCLSISVWIEAILNQLAIHHKIIYQEIPSLMVLFSYPIEYYKSTALLFITIILSLIVLNKIYIDHLFGNLLFVFLLVLSIFPFVDYMLSIMNLSVYANRYFVPTFNAIILLFLFFLRDIISEKKIIEIIIISLFLSILLPHRINEVQKFYSNVEKTNLYCMNLLKKAPLVCESPGTFFPLFYQNKFNSTYTIFLVLYKSNTNKSALFDYYGIENFKKKFPLRNIIEWDKFRTKYDSFYLIDQKKYPLFENNILNNANFIIEKDIDSIYYVQSKQ